MFTDNIIHDDSESTSLTADMTDDSYRLDYIEIVPLTRDADDTFTTNSNNGGWSAEVKQEMSTDSVSHDDTESTSLQADMTDDSCRLEFIEIVPLTRDTDGPCTTECDGGDWSAEVKQENLQVMWKQEPDDVRCIVSYLLCAYK